MGTQTNAELNVTLRSMHALKAEMDKDIPVMPEEIFRQHFLGLLTSPTPVDLRPWFDIVGHPQQQCHISRNGQIAYTIPPLVNTVSTGHGGDNAAVNQLARIRHLAITEQQANRMLEEHIDKFKTPVDDSTVERYLAMWKRVYAENNLPWDSRLDTPTVNADEGLFDGDAEPA